MRTRQTPCMYHNVMKLITLRVIFKDLFLFILLQYLEVRSLKFKLVRGMVGHELGLPKARTSIPSSTESVSWGAVPSKALAKNPPCLIQLLAAHGDLGFQQLPTVSAPSSHGLPSSESLSLFCLLWTLVLGYKRPHVAK